MALSDGIESHRAFSDGWRGLRDFLLSSRRFQRFAAAFPLTRPIARRRAADLFDLCAGFVYSQVLAACVRLDLFAQLRGGPLPVATLAARASIPVGAMVTLLEAGASLRLLERRVDQRYGLGPLGAAMLGNPGVAAMVEHHAALYTDLADPVALLRGELDQRKLGRYWPYAGQASPSAVTREGASSYTALMSASQPMVAEMVIGAYSFAKHRCLLDVGGGDGSFLIAVGGQAPELELRLFDLPGVASIARDRFAEAGLRNRMSVIEGNFLADPLPSGADVISLIRVVHDHDDDVVMQLFARVREALPKDGVLVIGEPMSSESGPDPTSAYFGLYLHAMGSGRPRSFAALREMLKQSGFRDVRSRATRIPMIAKVAVARA
ncbi:methyltransferase [Bradyrhizobium guangzhouense]|uniref:Methyltransferase n=1 Tax=Bradyrhizobium guangzhouense TaxID=1325095 RepID=A0AAE5WWG3_9BRAD|nr:methyltransferase [Bradyrhizobium guangzhouense]QAU44359.1 methyltransferase [Bradyrhizobium guangzhouense]RXH10070.1 methyltransferase [Bradyrhizobium guangzhouense]